MQDVTTYTMTSLKPLSPEEAEPQAREIMDKTKAGLGMVPNMYATMANLPAMFASYAFGYDQFRKASGFSPAEQEIVLLSVSRENGCGYCMAAHSMLADTMSGVPENVTNALRAGQRLPDEKLEALADFSRQMVLTRGRPTASDVDRFTRAGYGEKHILGIILAISVKTISNYSNHVFATEVDDAFSGRKWG